MFDIAGLYISNSEDNPRMYQIPYTDSKKSLIAPHGHCILWADEESDKHELHLPFKLPSSGGRLILSAYDRQDSTLLWRDEIVYTPHNDDKSFGRYPDGSDKLHVLHTPTPCGTNTYSSHNSFITNDTVTGYQIEEKLTEIKSTAETSKKIVSIKYYNTKGVEINNIIDENSEKIVIRRTIYSDGTTKSEKTIIK